MTDRTFRVGLEPDFGAKSTTAPVPDPSRVSYVALKCDRANIAPIGEPVVAQRDEARAGPYIRPPEPVTIYNTSGVPYRNAKGKVSVTVRANLLGTGVGDIEDYDNHPLTWLLGASMPSTADEVAAINVTGGSSANSFTMASPSGVKPGQLIKAIKNGLAEYTAVTKVTAAASDTIDHSPALSAGLTSGQVRGMRTFFVPNGAIVPGSSVSFQEDGPGWRQRAFGCRWSTCQIVIEGEEAIFKFDFEAPYIGNYNSEADVTAGTNVIDPLVPAGPMTSLLGGVSVVSSASAASQAAGAKLGRTPIKIGSGLTINLTATLAPRGASDTILGMSDLVVADMKCEISATLETIVTALDDLLLNREPRSLMVGFGGGGNGTGMCAYIPAAVVLNDPGIRDASGELVKQVLKVEPGHWGGDATASDTGLSGSIFRLGLCA